MNFEDIQLPVLRSKYVSKIKTIFEILKNNKQRYVAAYLFGSCSRGTTRFGSDVDICLVIPDDIPRFSISDIVAEIIDDYSDVHADCVVLRKSTFEKAATKLIQEIQQDKILLMKGDQS